VDNVDGKRIFNCIISYIYYNYETLKNIQLFKAVSDLEEYIKSSWEVSKSEILIVHGELLSLEEF